MWSLAVINFPEAGAFLTAVALLVGAVWAIGKYKTVEKPGSIINQQSTLLTDMREMYETMEQANDRLRAEIIELRGEIASLRAELGGVK